MVRSGGAEEKLLCGGIPMTTADSTGGAPAGQTPEIELGKSFVDAEDGLEVLCTKAGFGPLEYDGRELVVEGRKAAPPF